MNNHHTSFVRVCIPLKLLVYHFDNINGNVSIMSYWKKPKHSFLIHQSFAYNNKRLIIDPIRSKLSMSSKSIQIISIYFTLFSNQRCIVVTELHITSNIVKTNKHCAFNQQILKHVNIVCTCIWLHWKLLCNTAVLFRDTHNLFMVHTWQSLFKTFHGDFHIVTIFCVKLSVSLILYDDFSMYVS